MKIPTANDDDRQAILDKHRVLRARVITPRGKGVGSGNNNGRTEGKGKEPFVPKVQHDNNHLPIEGKPSAEARETRRLACHKLYEYWRD